MNARSFLPSQLSEFEDRSDPQLEAAAELEDIAHHLDLESWITHRLLHPERELTANLVIARENGAPAVFTGYRVQHLTSRGPTMGGVGFTPHVSLSAVRAAAMESTWQAALLKLPFGGAAGAVICNTEELSEDELRQLSKQYAHALRGLIGRSQDILAPGSGCNQQMIAWMLDSIASDEGRLEPAVATGKPDSMYGLADYSGMTALGIVTVIDLLLGGHQTTGAARLSRSDRGRKDFSNVHVGVQGFGFPGSSIARALYDRGARIVAVSDISGGLQDRNGINIPALQRYVEERRVIFGFPDAHAACNADVLEADCEVLITAASERQISLSNAESIRAQIVLEASKWAVTSGAERLLTARGTVVVPEILTTGGAAIAGFLEWNQSARFVSISASEAQAELADRIRAALDSVIAASGKNAISFRNAAHLIAIDRIASEMRMRR
jgi:glutamate dehydrogenase (NAD(P)+)